MATGPRYRIAPLDRGMSRKPRWLERGNAHYIGSGGVNDVAGGIRVNAGGISSGRALLGSSESSRAAMVESPARRHLLAIMAGGQGTRLKAASNKWPKQFLRLTDPSRSMLQVTADRFLRGLLPFLNPEQVFIITAKKFLSITAEQMPEIPGSNIISELAAKSTGPAISAFMYHVAQKDPETVVAIVPSDHFIGNTQKYLDYMQEAVRHARLSRKIVTLGIKPTWPSPEYGYIRQSGLWTGQDGPDRADGPHQVEQFVQKPSAETAAEFISAGKYLWNSGMIVAAAGVFIRTLETYRPDWVLGLKDVYKNGGPGGTMKLSMELFFGGIESISIDRALLEPASLDSRIDVIPMEDIGWSDAGTWKNLQELVSLGLARPAPEILEVMERMEIDTKRQEPAKLPDDTIKRFIEDDRGSIALQNWRWEQVGARFLAGLSSVAGWGKELLGINPTLEDIHLTTTSSDIMQRTAFDQGLGKSFATPVAVKRVRFGSADLKKFVDTGGLSIESISPINIDGQRAYLSNVTNGPDNYIFLSFNEPSAERIDCDAVIEFGFDFERAVINFIGVGEPLRGKGLHLLLLKAAWRHAGEPRKIKFHQIISTNPLHKVLSELEKTGGDWPDISKEEWIKEFFAAMSGRDVGSARVRARADKFGWGRVYDLIIDLTPRSM